MYDDLYIGASRKNFSLRELKEGERESLRTGEVPIEKMLHFEPRKRKFMQL
jgi:hypothetical protein